MLVPLLLLLLQLLVALPVATVAMVAWVALELEVVAAPALVVAQLGYACQRCAHCVDDSLAVVVTAMLACVDAVA